jgi:hypothetical protein
MKGLHKSFVYISCGALLAAIYSLTALSENKPVIKHMSDIVDVHEPRSVLAVIPDLNLFMRELRAGSAARTFFDSPLGLHFLKSAPFRGGAHLHRLISLAPRSWQWDLYTLISSGPVVYHSSGKHFLLMIGLNAKGEILTSLLKQSHAAKINGWLVIASDEKTLQQQLAYIKSPKPAPSPLDALLAKTHSLHLSTPLPTKEHTTKGLWRSLFANIITPGTSNLPCLLSVTPAENQIALTGECQINMATQHNRQTERLHTPRQSGYAYFYQPNSTKAHLITFGGFTSNRGLMIPHIYFSGPVTDQKNLEFLSQAFKTRNHILETKNGAIQIKFPYAYNRKVKHYDLFAPHLAADNQRFYWQSYLHAMDAPSSDINIDPKFDFYGLIDINETINQNKSALQSFDAIYSTGHFHEFRDALFKSATALKDSTISLYTRNAGKTLRIGGNWSFAAN